MMALEYHVGHNRSRCRVATEQAEGFMTTHRFSMPLSRRMALAGLAGLGLVGGPTVAHATAQGATPSASPVSRDGHPISGVWYLNGHDPTINYTFHVDGTAFGYNPDLGIGIGRWRTTGARTGEAIVVYQNIAGQDDPASFDEMFEPDYVSAGHAFVPGVAITRWTSVEVDAEGAEISLLGSFEGREPDGSLGVRWDDEGWVGTRLVVVGG
jgi:hypothetical protein